MSDLVVDTYRSLAADMSGVANKPSVAPDAAKKNEKQKKIPGLAVWPEAQPLEQNYNLPMLHPMITKMPWHYNFYNHVDFMGAETKDTVFYYLYKRAEREWEFRFSPHAEQKLSKYLTEEAINNFMGLAGVSPDYIMNYITWFDGWDYQDFPKIFCETCKNMGKVPVITWEPNFKRSYTLDKNGQMMPFLDELITGLSDKRSEVYKYAVKFAKGSKEYGETIYLRPFHEMNLDFGYQWTGFLNGAENDKIGYKTGKDGAYILDSKGNGIADGPERFKTAWILLRKIFLCEGADNVKFVFCPDAQPQKKGAALQGDSDAKQEAWNTYEAYFPGSRYVDMIGFDVYQKDENFPFDTLFKDAAAFIKKHKDVPGSSICEASTWPWPYRKAFINDLFASSNKYGIDNMRFICWFNENKEDGRWKIDTIVEDVVKEAAKNVEIWRPGENALTLEDLMSGEAVIPEPEVVEEADTRNISLYAFREAVKNRGNISSRTFRPSINPECENVEDTRISEIAHREYKLPDNKLVSTYNKARDMYFRVKLRNELKKAVDEGSIIRFLKKIKLDRERDPRKILETARKYGDMWLADPQRYRMNMPIKDPAKKETVSMEEEAVKMLWLKYPETYNNEKQYDNITITDFQKAVWLLDSITPSEDMQEFKKYYNDKKEYLLAFVDKAKLYIKYSDIYLNATFESSANERASTIDALTYAEGACRKVLDLLKDMTPFRSYIWRVNHKSAGLPLGEVFGRQATILMLLGDIYMDDTRRTVKYDKGVEGVDGKTIKGSGLEIAKYFYHEAEKKIKAKEKETGEKETYINVAVETGLARASGIQAAGTLDKDRLNEAVNRLITVIRMDKKIDPGLKIKAKYYLGELLLLYGGFKGNIDNSIIGEKIGNAYSIFSDLKKTELAERAKDKEKEAKSLYRAAVLGSKNR
ncbi:MAG: glycosyl hydrolase [bacterium]